MRGRILLAAVSTMAIILLMTPAVALADETVLSPAQVVELDPSLDGTTVVVEGEAVGDVLRALGGGSWVNILGDEVGLGIWMTADMVERIEHLGHYKHSGDLIRVTGTLNRTCEEHGGEFDVHAEEMEILAPGEPLTHHIRPREGTMGVVGFIIGSFLLFRYLKLRANSPL